jgi:hypothetical protein
VDVQQTYGDLDVLFADAKVKVNPSVAISSLSSSFTPIGQLDMVPRVNQSQAILNAKSEYDRQLQALPQPAQAQIRAAQGANPPEAARLVIFDPKLVGLRAPTARLSWLAWISTERN